MVDGRVSAHAGRRGQPPGAPVSGTVDGDLSVPSSPLPADPCPTPPSLP